MSVVSAKAPGRSYKVSRDVEGKVRVWLLIPTRKPTELEPRGPMSHKVDQFDVGNRTKASEMTAYVILYNALGKIAADQMYVGFNGEILQCLKLKPGEAKDYDWRDIQRWYLAGGMS